MNTFSKGPLVALMACLLSVAMYAVDQKAAVAAANAFPPMVLPVAGPAVPTSVTPGAGPETISAPKARSVSATESKGLANSAGYHFDRAKEAYLKNDTGLSATEVRKGTAVLRAEKSKATGDARRELAAAAVNLEMLAARIEQNRVMTGFELDTAFARANQALARLNLEKTATPGTAKTPAIAATPYQSVTPRPDIPATAARQGMPEPAKEPMSAAYADPLTHTPVTPAPTYEELKTRVDALSKEIADLRAELKKLKARETAATN